MAARSGPSPTIRRSTPGSSRSASTTSEGRFSGTRLPTARSVGRVRPNLPRAASRSAGWNSARSTPLRNTRTRSGATQSRASRSAESARHRHKAGRARRRPAHPASRQRIVGNDVEVAAARGHHHRTPKRAAEQHRGHTVGIEVMRVDQVEIGALANLPAQLRQHRAGERQRRRGHADLGQQRIARMIDQKPMANFSARHPSVSRIPAETPGCEWKPRHRRHDSGFDGTALH